jgi:two-component system, OmpR family, alkaline phosphatase synthesis response regulator PhoP
MEKHTHLFSKPGHVLTKRALVVDDDPIICMVLRLFLETENRFEVKELLSGAHAQEVALSWKPHIILLDLEMPDPNGIATFHTLRSNAALANMPICFVTGSAEPEIHKSLLEMGAAFVFTKPMQMAQVKTIYEISLSSRSAD